MRGCIGTTLFVKLAIIALLGIGWMKCIVNALGCNWEPIGKAEVVYTIGVAVPVAGGVIGWMDIEDK